MRFRNPVIPGFHPDPSVCRAGNEHFLRYLSTEVTGGFLARMIGMYAVGGDAAFDWFDHEEA